MSIHPKDPVDTWLKVFVGVFVVVMIALVVLLQGWLHNWDWKCAMNKKCVVVKEQTHDRR